VLRPEPGFTRRGAAERHPVCCSASAELYAGRSAHTHVGSGPIRALTAWSGCLPPAAPHRPPISGVQAYEPTHVGLRHGPGFARWGGDGYAPSLLLLRIGPSAKRRTGRSAHARGDPALVELRRRGAATRHLFRCSAPAGGRAALRPKRPHAWDSCSDRASPGGESAERPPIRVGRALDSARRSISLGQGGAGTGRPFRILSQTPPHQPCCRGDAPKEGLHLSTNHRRRSAQRWW